ncbi:Restriction endonuclease subunit S [Pseudomonas sp. IT-P171]
MCSPQSKEQNCWVKVSVSGRTRSAVEGILQPVQLIVVAVDGDHVETARGIGPTRLALKKILRGNNQFLPFALIDAIERATPLSVFSVANFNEYYCIAIKHDQIKLAAFTQPVLRQQAQTLLLKMLERVALGIFTALLA